MGSGSVSKGGLGLTAAEGASAGETFSNSGALSMLVRGFPIGRTLGAVAAVAAHLREEARSAVLLTDEEQLSIAAACELFPGDRDALNDLCEHGGTGELSNFAVNFGAEVKLLVTQTAELVGAVIVFGFSGSQLDENIRLQFEEVCSIATLAIEQKHLSEELSYRAHHDPLTHLWNRLWMEEEIARALNDSLDTGLSTGLIVIALDSFRLINGLLGSRAGNELLRRVAERLQGAMEHGFALARGGGDEFFVLVPNLTSKDRLTSFAAQLLTWFVEPFQIGDHQLLVRASLGTAVAACGECDAGELQHRADTAMRHAKKSSRGQIAAFESSMITMPPERLVMEKHLRFALQKREFEIFYQPQIHLPTGSLTAVEALLRWKHPSLGYISPSAFIPILEDMGFIEDIGDWVIQEAIRQLEIWHHAGLDGLRVAVNVSPSQFLRNEFANSVARRLRTASIRPEDLELEITENTVMTDFAHGLRQLTLLRSLGILIALDDFGTGHSSLAYLQQLPIQRLKIDQMFIRRITQASDRPPLLSSIIQMGHGLDCSVIAEGVETVDQARALAAMSCTEVQGYFFSKPLPAGELLRWAKQRNPLPVSA
ncbi:MAG TPA: bifunctional diguanylate cyclase/phosphodiesterase [Bryobacteraceae bacterium]|jgi:diguanylate cyclase (GGDEF)-like protein|nr:bifunctional diguanylate cyclase/phosphodiesterase [Bryobacteraceae bacterium]